MNLRGLYNQIVDVNGDEESFEPLFTGEFCFDITYSCEPTKYVLDVSNMTYGGHTEEWDYTVTPTYFAITPMSVDWSCTYTCTNERMVYGLSFRVVMKDGTSPLLTTARSGLSVGTSLFYNPIDLSEVDYILIGDEDLGSTYKLISSISPNKREIAIQQGAPLGIINCTPKKGVRFLLRTDLFSFPKNGRIAYSFNSFT